MSQEYKISHTKGSVVGRFFRNRKGVAAAEFALILPVFVSMIFGTLEYSIMLFTYSSMQTTARDIARQVAVNNLTPSEAQAKLASRLPPWMASSATMKITQTKPADPTANIIQVNLSVPTRLASPITFFSRGTTSVLETQAEMKQELPFGKL